MPSKATPVSGVTPEHLHQLPADRWLAWMTTASAQRCIGTTPAAQVCCSCSARPFRTRAWSSLGCFRFRSRGARAIGMSTCARPVRADAACRCEVARPCWPLCCPIRRRPPTLPHRQRERLRRDRWPLTSRVCIRQASNPGCDRTTWANPRPLTCPGRLIPGCGVDLSGRGHRPGHGCAAGARGGQSAPDQSRRARGLCTPRVRTNYQCQQ
jgi:hypothetical protein